MQNKDMAEPTAKKQVAKPAATNPKPQGEITWGGFCALNPPKAVKENVFRTEDTLCDWLSPATLKFYRKHGITRVYAPGAFPL
jgi:hypothetical protein